MKSFKWIFILIILISGSIKAADFPQTSPQYLTGRFDPALDTRFVSLSKLGIPVNKSPQYLRIEAAEALKKMINDFHREYPKVPFYITSSTRNFNSQKTIWNGKWKGKRKSNGEDLSKVKDPLKRAHMILEYSSMPGTSRHHWGTDFDINSLTNSYYEIGEGRILFNWLNEHAAKYGFARPYTPKRTKGYHEERWHWSYLPIARECYRAWMKNFGEDTTFFTQKGIFDGSEKAWSFAREYVESINPECK